MTEAEGSIKEDKSIWDQLMELKVLTLRTGAISEHQVTQLKMWAGLIYKSTVEIQIIVETDPSVTFIPKIPEYISEHILKGLSRSTKAILGVQFSVFVKNPNNEVIFSSYGDRSNPKQLKLIKE